MYNAAQLYTECRKHCNYLTQLSGWSRQYIYSASL
jgi:hypothetical protein